MYNLHSPNENNELEKKIVDINDLTTECTNRLALFSINIFKF